MEDFGPAIRGALADRREYSAIQKAHFTDTFDLTETPSAVRAAQAIADFLEEIKTFKRESKLVPFRAAS
jgi:hypothetical protein